MLPELSLAEQIALCNQAGVTHYSLRPRIIPPNQRDQPWSFWGNHKFDLTPQRLQAEVKAIRRQLEDGGLEPFGTNPSANTNSSDEELKVHFDGAAAVGAGRVRVAPAPYPARHFDYSTLLDQIVDRYAHILPLAKAAGIKIVIETHMLSMAASPALAWNICRQFDPSEIGVIFDVPNFTLEGGLAPNLAVAVLDQYIDHCHVGGMKRTEGEVDDLGFRQSGRTACALTESDSHIPSWIRALHDANKHVPLVIEDFQSGRGGENLKGSVDQLKRILRAIS